MNFKGLSRIADAKYTVQPKTKEELQQIIVETIEEQGPNCDLNFIDTSLITDMSRLFKGSEFNGDISNWDVSNVTDMTAMFRGSEFNGDISNWDVSRVLYMRWMFEYSKFNGDISNWDVSHVQDMRAMFNISSFNGDISKWNVSDVCKTNFMFDASPLELTPPSWYASVGTSASSSKVEPKSRKRSKTNFKKPLSKDDWVNNSHSSYNDYVVQWVESLLSGIDATLVDIDDEKSESAIQVNVAEKDVDKLESVVETKFVNAELEFWDYDFDNDDRLFMSITF